MNPPAPLRPPTRREQRHFDKHGRWPDSYVDARLAHSDAVGAWLDSLPPTKHGRRRCAGAPEHDDPPMRRATTDSEGTGEWRGSFRWWPPR